MRSRLLSYAEAAAFLGCSVKTVRRRVAAGELPVVVDHGLRRITEPDLRAYVAARRRAPVGPRGTGPRTRTPNPLTVPDNVPGRRVRRLWEDGDEDA